MIKPAKIVKYTTIFLGCGICMIGAALIVEGMLLLLHSGMFGAKVVTLFNEISYSNIKFGTLLSAMVYIIIVSGFVTLITGIVVMYGATRKKTCSLHTFIVLAIVLVLVHGILIGFWVYARLRSNQWLEGEMLQLLAKYKGPQETDGISEGWNQLFMQAKCCGVNDQYTDGATSSDFVLQQSVWSSTNANTEKVPATCCQGTEEDDISSSINSACTTTPKDYYQEGCYEALYDLINTHSIVVFCLTGFQFIITLLAIVASSYLQNIYKNRITSFFKT